MFAIFRVGFILDLPTSRASKVELGARKIYTMQGKTERETWGRGTSLN